LADVAHVQQGAERRQQPHPKVGPHANSAQGGQAYSLAQPWKAASAQHSSAVSGTLAANTTRLARRKDTPLLTRSTRLVTCVASCRAAAAAVIEWTPDCLKNRFDSGGFHAAGRAVDSRGKIVGQRIHVCAPKTLHAIDTPLTLASGSKVVCIAAADFTEDTCVRVSTAGCGFETADGPLAVPDACVAWRQRSAWTAGSPYPEASACVGHGPAPGVRRERRAARARSGAARRPRGARVMVHRVSAGVHGRRNQPRLCQTNYLNTGRQIVTGVFWTR
jgi:hypothetical protein